MKGVQQVQIAILTWASLQADSTYWGMVVRHQALTEEARIVVKKGCQAFVDTRHQVSFHGLLC